MASLRSERAFLDWYRREQADAHVAARVLGEFLRKTIAASEVFLHVVEARAKSVDSMRAKLLSKNYKNPRTELTDLVAARVIVYDARDVERAVDAIRAVVRIRMADSSDKRTFLGPREFGYRSYHIVAALGEQDATRLEYRALHGRWFEIQVRSILEHVWAEIEHEVVYKARARFPNTVLRKFASVAAVLELLDQDFGDLIQSDIGLVPAARKALKEGHGLRAKLDVPHLLAALDLEFPDGVTFATGREARGKFPPRIEARVLLALKRCGVSTVTALRKKLTSPEVRKALRRYARQEGVSIAGVSHIAAASLVIAIHNRLLWETYFPEFVDNLPLRRAIGSE
jgi:ppGpp synthetase/RelA/SpoT-type nucleotidyltranferase